MSLTLEGDRFGATVIIDTKQSNSFITHMSGNACQETVSKLRKKVCSHCKLFNRECRGAGSILTAGAVVTKYVVEKDTAAKIQYVQCRIPSSTIEVSDKGIRTASKDNIYGLLGVQGKEE